MIQISDKTASKKPKTLEWAWLEIKDDSNK